MLARTIRKESSRFSVGPADRTSAAITSAVRLLLTQTKLTRNSTALNRIIVGVENNEAGIPTIDALMIAQEAPIKELPGLISLSKDAAIRVRKLAPDSKYCHQLDFLSRRLGQFLEARTSAVSVTSPLATLSFTAT